MSEKPSTQTFTVAITFETKTGEIVDVEPQDGSKLTKLGEVLHTKMLLENDLKSFSQQSMLFAWGSPACWYIPTKYGYIKICK